MTRLRTQDSDTICALASASGTAGISVIRLSGPKAISLCRSACPFLPESLESHRVFYGKFRDPRTGTVIDEVLVTHFQQGRSFTGEDTMEISTHGNPLLVSEVLRVLVEAGARPADRGEFSYRAYLNGRIDLVQAEGLLDLIESQTKKAADLSLRQLEGGLSSRIQEIKYSLTRVLAHLEANIDFAAEGIEIESLDRLKKQIQQSQTQIGELIETERAGRIIHSGFQVILMGRPNVGKSSLLNGLLEQERSIVTAIPGTTRDLIEGILTIDGYRIEITDTAGLRDSQDEIEKIGQNRARKKMDQADLILLVLDSSTSLFDQERELLEALPKDRAVLIWNKMDLKVSTELQNWNGAQLSVSALKGYGLEQIKSLISQRLHKEAPVESSSVSLNARHYKHLVAAQKFLGDSLTLMVKEQSPDVIALDLHEALREIHLLLGEVYDDQVMDAVFNQFCIGK